MKTSITFLCLLSLMLLSISTLGQKKSVGKKAVETTEKANKISREVSEASNKVKENAQQIAENANSVVTNVREVIKAFEPILLHFTKSKKKSHDNTERTSGGNQTGGIVQSSSKATNPSEPPYSTVNNSAIGDTYPPSSSESRKYESSGYPDYGVPENKNYNSDGTLNWSNHNNPTYGCALNALLGESYDIETAAQKPKSVDLIFLAPSDGQNAYYLVTPGFAQSNNSADCFFGSCVTDNPIKSWPAVNESEIALTSITGEQFNKIKTTNQVKAAVKAARNFAPFYTSLGKLDGKVFAIKTEMDDRETYALIYVIKHYGTSGSSGYLKVKILCPGLDSNGDGNPDAENYLR